MRKLTSLPLSRSHYLPPPPPKRSDEGSREWKRSALRGPQVSSEALAMQGRSWTQANIPRDPESPPTWLIEAAIAREAALPAVCAQGLRMHCLSLPVPAKAAENPSASLHMAAPGLSSLTAEYTLCREGSRTAPSLLCLQALAACGCSCSAPRSAASTIAPPETGWTGCRPSLPAFSTPIARYGTPELCSSHLHLHLLTPPHALLRSVNSWVACLQLQLLLPWACTLQ